MIHKTGFYFIKIENIPEFYKFWEVSYRSGKIDEISRKLCAEPKSLRIKMRVEWLIPLLG